MQHIDLLEHESATTSHVASVCIIGAGAGGLFLARRLADAGIDTVLVEAGSERVVKAADTDLLPEFSRDVYDGAINGRGFGLGGSTALWGGVLVPYTRHDL